MRSGPSPLSTQRGAPGGAWSWMRSLLLVARAGATGALSLRAHGRSAAITLARGAVVGFEGDLGPRIGELVGVPTGRGELWGAQTLAEGRVSRNDLAWALRRQMRLRARELALWGDLEASWRAEARAERPFTDPMDVCDLVAETLRAGAEHRVTPAGSSEPRSDEMLTTLGAWWAQRAALFPHELAGLRGGSQTRERSPASLRFAGAARAAGLLEVPVSQEVRELTRVHAAWRRGGADAVLGRGGDAAARRRTFREVAGAVHPDRFARDPALGVISHEIVSRLSAASGR